MFKLIAYLIAIFSLYRKQLLMLFLALLATLILLPIVKQADPQKVPTQSTQWLKFEPSLNVEAIVGKKFVSLAELKAAELHAGYVATGYFGNSWPATVSEVSLANDKITFTQQNGTTHTYKGFGGYRLKVVRLLDQKQREVIVIFRSKNKS